MKGLQIAGAQERLEILCIGAHSDDIEIGLGGTLLALATNVPRLRVHWCVCSAKGVRADEAQASAAAFLRDVPEHRIHLGNFDDSYFPAQSRELKQWLIEIRSHASPDIVFTHSRADAHQDHRQVNELSWNLFRDQIILEYEIPKWDGDLAPRNLYVPLSEELMDRKIALLMRHFETQRVKDWFDAETIRGLARLRGMECRAPERFAEGFSLRKGSLLF